MFEAKEFAAKTYQQYRDRSDAIAKKSNLQDGERKIQIRPGFDLRQTEDHRFGQGSPTLIFMERRGNITIDCSFYMGWNVLGEASISMDGRDIGVIGLGFYAHARFKKDTKTPDYAHHSKICPLLGDKPCYGEAGSSLYGDKLKWTLMSYGEDGIWDEINEAFKEYDL